MSKKVKKVAPNYSEASYIITNGIRYVAPYVFEFTTFAKGRWLGRELFEVLSREFGGQSKDYWINAIKLGNVRINNRIVNHDHKFRNGDAMLHRTHRHEPPIVGEITFVGETDKYMAINKPASLPVHPCGAYKYNSLTCILQKEPLIPNQPHLHLVHRLDRVTSGLMILAKSKEFAALISDEIRSKNTKKTYLARVRGKFPQNLDKIVNRISIDDFMKWKEEILEDDESKDKDADNDNVKYNDSATSDSTRNSTAYSDSTDLATNTKRKLVETESSSAAAVISLQEQKEAKKKLKIANGSSNITTATAVPICKEDISGDYLPAKREATISPTIYSSDRVAIAYCNACDSTDACNAYSSGTGVTYYLKCPVGVLSHREGIHMCTEEAHGKQSVSSFTCKGYCEKSDTSLIECGLLTGRTHQLRLHLQLLGNPIANDPCYGGRLFYGEDKKRSDALGLLKQMRKSGYRPISKVPHFDDIELDQLVDEGEREILDEAENVVILPGEGADDSPRREEESDNDYLTRTCKYCKDKRSHALESILHCDGIWLHALRYEGSDWSFEAPRPAWSLPFDLPRPSLL